MDEPHRPQKAALSPVALALRCVGVVALGIVAGLILVVVNWSSVVGFETGGTAALPDLLRAKSAVAAYCKGGTVELVHKVRWKSPDAILSIELTDCRRFDELSPDTHEAEAEARRIAQVAYGSLMRKDRYRQVEVDVTMDYASQWQMDPDKTFKFEASELRASP